MATARSTKASDKQAICKKLVTQLKKRYSTAIPKNDRNVMATLLYGVCLEDRTHEEADTWQEALEARFLDWNEIRVSSITEIATVFEDDEDGEMRAVRIRAALQSVFDKAVATGEPREDPFDLEPLKRRTQDQAAAELVRIGRKPDDQGKTDQHQIGETTPFVRHHVLLAALGSHVIPLDARMFAAAAWLGLVEPDADLDAASDALKSAVRKTDGPLFVHLLRQLANDPKPRSMFETVDPENAEDYDPTTAVKRLPKAYAGYRAPRKKAPAKKKAAAKMRTSKKKAKKPAAKKSPAKKKAAKKTATKKSVAKKSAKKTTSRKSPAKKKAKKGGRTKK